jgi:tetratricopeptide (TPR) repeat protein
MLSQYLQARTHARQALIHLRLAAAPDPLALAAALYDLGSISYKLAEFAQARVHYEEAIGLLEEAGAEPYWVACVRGNLGLALVRGGDDSGRALVAKAKTIILSERGPHHYDYVFLVSQEDHFP